MTRRHARAFTLLELLVVISIIVMLIAILLPALMGVRRGARQQENGTRMKSLMDAMARFARGNRDYFPGLDKAGAIVPAGPNAANPLTSSTGAFPIARVGILLGGSFVEPKALINPIDPEVVPYQSSGAGTINSTTGVQVSGAPIAVKNFSFAMLQLVGTSRDQAWTASISPLAPIVSDRNNGSNNGGNVSSVWTEISKGVWNGSVGWGDLHVSFEQSHTVKTMFPASKSVFASDNLFNDGGSPDGGGDDAFMVYQDATNGWNQKP